MAFSILSDLIRDVSEKYFPAPAEVETVGASRVTVLKKTMPSQSLFDPKEPMPWVNSASTDIRRWRKE
jgi:hypothetical protein